MRALVFLLCFALPFSVSALEPQTGCEQMMQECFADTGANRSQCFATTARQTLCANSELRFLATERWAISPEQNQAPAFTGPQLIDKSCLENFDNKWSSMLIARGISKDEIQTLRQELQSCRQESTLDLPRL